MVNDLERANQPNEVVFDDKEGLVVSHQPRIDFQNPDIEKLMMTALTRIAASNQPGASEAFSKLNEFLSSDTSSTD